MTNEDTDEIDEVKGRGRCFQGDTSMQNAVCSNMKPLVF